MATHRLIVFSDSLPGQEEEFNAWYDDVHLTDVLAVDGFVAAQRFVLADAQLAGMTNGALGRYLAIYEIEAPSAKEALDKLRKAAGTMSISDSIDSKRAKALAFSAIGQRRTASGLD